jgi:hypothetical protein
MIVFQKFAFTRIVAMKDATGLSRGGFTRIEFVSSTAGGHGVPPLQLLHRGSITHSRLLMQSRSRSLLI